MKYEAQVSTQNDALNVRSGPGSSYPVVGSLPKGSVVTLIDKSGDWYKLSSGLGWCSASFLTITQNLDTSVSTSDSNNNNDNPSNQSSTGSSSGIDSNIISMLYASAQKVSSNLDSSTRLFGCPFQFMESADFRINSKIDIGRKFMETIIAEAPIVYFIPGKPNYLPDLADGEKKSMTSFFTSSSVSDDDAKSSLDKILGNTDIRYFDFIPDYTEYMRYVNLLCRMAAIYMGLGDKIAPMSTQSYKYYDWSNYKFKNNYTPKNTKNKSVFNVKNISDDLYETFFGKYQYVQFYVEPNSSFNESQTNNTTTSKLQGMFDSAEGIIKEVSFLTNTAAVKDLNGVKDSFAQGMDDIAQKMLKNSKENFFTRLLGMSSTVLTGSNIIFPELWGDSAYNKSYSVSIHLVSPYGDPESVYLNIIVPMLHALALTLPRQSTANSYASPFLVKVFSKGWFSCELGIIDSISIDKGGENEWTADGLPSECKISLSIKDLYTNLMQTSSSKPELFFQNQGLIDFLAVSCGVDITLPNFILKLESMMSVFLGNILDLPRNAFKDFIQDIRNEIEPLFKI